MNRYAILLVEKQLLSQLLLNNILRETMEKTFQFRGKSIDLTDDRVRLDFDSPLEFALVVIAVFSSFFIILIPLTLVSINWIAVPLSIFILSLALRYSVDCTYIIDNKLKRIDYSRSIWGSETVNTICQFAEINCVTLNCRFVVPSRNGVDDQADLSGHIYNVVIVTNGGKLISATENEGCSPEKAYETAQMFAEHFGTTCLKGQEKSRVIVSPHPTGVGVEVTFEEIELGMARRIS